MGVGLGLELGESVGSIFGQTLWVLTEAARMVTGIVHIEQRAPVGQYLSPPQ
jgi:hypothetical protein